MVFNVHKTLAGLHNCIEQKLIVGVATSVCQTNYALVSEDWLRRLIGMGVMYAWFHTYRVIGPNPAPELALTPEQVHRLRRFTVTMRRTLPIGIVGVARFEIVGVSGAEFVDRAVLSLSRWLVRVSSARVLPLYYRVVVGVIPVLADVADGGQLRGIVVDEAVEAEKLPHQRPRRDAAARGAPRRGPARAA